MSNFKKEKKDLLNKVKHLKEFVKTLDDDKVYRNIVSFQDEIKSDLTFNVLCVGDFSSGKSTFINNFFIGKSVLPTNVTTTTAKLTILKYGEEERIRLIKKDGSSQEVTVTPDTSLKEYVARDGSQLNEIEKVEVYINSEFLKEGVIIVDSPGLNDPETERMKVTLDYVNNADSVLYLLTAQQAWKNNEKEFLENKIFRKDDLDKIFFLINYWDMIENENDRKDLLNFVHDEMNKSIEFVSSELAMEISTPPVIPISAKTKENFDQLKEVLWDYLGSKKGKDIIEAKQKKAESIKQYIGSLLKEKIEVQMKKEQEITSMLDSLKQEIETYKKEVDEFKSRLSSDIEVVVESWSNDIESYLRKIENIIQTKIQQNIEGKKNEEELRLYIRKVIVNTFSLEEGELYKINKSLISKLTEIAQKEHARLTISQYFINDDILEVDKLVEQMKGIEPEVAIDYARSIMITTGSVVGALIAASIFPPLGLLGGLGIAYNFVDLKKEEMKKILRQPEILDAKIQQVIAEKRKEIELSKDQIIDDVLNTIRNEITEAYEEKKRLYEQALENKKSKEDSIVIEQYKKQIEELSTL
jgi:predicted GTPase